MSSKQEYAYQKVNFGDDSNFWMDWKSKMDLERIRKQMLEWNSE